MNMSLVIMEGNYGSIDADDSSLYGYYIIKFSSSPYNLQADLVIDGQVISSSEILCEVTYLFPININYHHYALQKTKSINRIVYLRKIINDNVNVICYYFKDFVLPYLRSISQNDYNTLPPLRIPIEDNDNITDENNQRETI